MKRIHVLFAALLIVAACSGADEGVRTIDDGGGSGSGSSSASGVSSESGSGSSSASGVSSEPASSSSQ